MPTPASAPKPRRRIAWLYAILAAGLFVFLGEEYRVLPPGATILLVVTALMLGSSAKSSVRHGRRDEQQIWEKDSVALIEDLRAGKGHDFVLYLRPFTLDAALPVRSSLISLGPISPMTHLHGESEEFEEILHDVAARNRVTLLSLGMRDARGGAARLQIGDAEWFDLFGSLAGAARKILLVPGASAGCREEILWLRKERQLGKTFIVQPVSGKGELKAEWQRAQAEWQKDGLTLPDFAKRCGRICLFGEDGSIAQEYLFAGNSRRRLAKALKICLREMTVSVPPPITRGSFPPLMELVKLVEPQLSEREKLEKRLAGRWACKACGEANAAELRRCLFCRTRKPSPDP